MEFVLFIINMANVLLLLSLILFVVHHPDALLYTLSIHLCNVHFVAIHHKTGIIKCLNILNVE